jgi:hypothetical protein
MPSGIIITQPIPAPVPPVPVSLKYGAFYDKSFQSIAVPYDEQTIAISTTSFSNGVTLGANQLVFNTAGTYNIQVSVQVTNHHPQDQLFYLWFAYMGVNITDSSSIATIPSTHGGHYGFYIISLNIFVQVNAGDNVELRWTADNIDVHIEGYNPAIGTIPISPAVIVTATQV